MTPLHEAAQQALDVMNDVNSFERWSEAKEALRAALAEPVQEPVAWGGDPSVQDYSSCYPKPVQEPVAWMYEDEPYFDGKKDIFNYRYTGSKSLAEFKSGTLKKPIPLYTAPPQRKPLTEEEIEKAYREIWRDLPSDFDHTSSGWIEQGIRYAERAHGIGAQDEP